MPYTINYSIRIQLLLKTKNYRATKNKNKNKRKEFKLYFVLIFSYIKREGFISSGFGQKISKVCLIIISFKD